MKRALFVAAALVSGRAIAEPAAAVAIDLTRCEYFDPVAARSAIDAELVAPVEQRSRLGELTVVVTCPDATTAIVAVTPGPPDGPLAKRIELGEVPERLRLRLLALASAELVAATLGLTARPVDLAAAPAPVASPPAAVTATPVASASPRHASRATPSFARRRALLGGDDAGFRVFARAGLRRFTAQVDAIPEAAVGASRGPLAVDAFAASGTGDDALGAVRGTVGGAGVAATLACRGGSGTWVCASVRGALGAARLTADPAHPRIVDRAFVDLYGELGPRLDVRLEVAGWSGELGLGAGWSWGPVARAADREVLRLSGPIVLGGLAVGWSP